TGRARGAWWWRYCRPKAGSWVGVGSESEALGDTHDLHVAAGRAGATISVRPAYLQARRPESLQGERLRRRACLVCRASYAGRGTAVARVTGRSCSPFFPDPRHSLGVGLGRCLAEGVCDVGRKVDDLRPLNAETSLTPLAETAPHVVGVDLQGLADVLEREEPRAVDREHPLARLLEHLPSPWVPGVGVLLVAVDGILEHGEHQETLALEAAGPPEGREVLRG